MSCCEIIPNNSVHWAVTHEDLNGQAKQRAARAPSAATNSPGDVVTVAADGTVGVDSVDPADIGTGKDHHGNPKNHKDKFRVTLRFKTLDEAIAAFDKALKDLNKNPRPNQTSGLYEAVVDITASPTNQKNADQHPMNPYAQICTVW
ncbi:MAG: hypothetical protein EXQ48_02625 [Acidobacteria bacterium]|nr:hypothetical protein [Acidobacteriota bacterium]